MNKRLTPSDIVGIVRSGEGFNFEFKISVPRKAKEITEEICAFANSAGGAILIGVSDNNIIYGVDIDNRKRSAIQDSINEIDPHLSVEMYSVDIEGKKVWVIEVSSGSQKPYTFSGAIYVRQGPNTQKLTSAEQMRDFFQQSDRIYFDEAPCDAFSIESDIDHEWFEEFRFEAGLSKTISREQIIKNLRIIYPNQKVKNGGVLFFGKSPEVFIDSAVIRCVAFEGTTKTHIIDDKTYGGPLVVQYRETMQWLKRKLDVRYIIEGGGPRKEVWEIPETAFKEALINAVSHRDYYEKGAKTNVELFEDRVEISNPGGLVSAIPIEEFGTRSVSRNPLIFGLFGRTNLVEEIGSGIRRMNDAMVDASLPKPVYKTKGIFTVVLLRPDKTIEKTTKELEEKTTREKIIELIRNNPSVTIREMADTVGITDKGVEYQLAKLQKERILTREGSKKSGSWRLRE